MNAGEQIINLSAKDRRWPWTSGQENSGLTSTLCRTLFFGLFQNHTKRILNFCIKIEIMRFSTTLATLFLASASAFAPSAYVVTKSTQIATSSALNS